ncbi:MAG: thioredoxin domain-containing protein [Patescibacteria group bacterium]
MEEKINQSEVREVEQKQKRDYLLPASILIAAVLISTALIYNVGKKSDGSGNLNANLGGAPTNAIQPDAIDLSDVFISGNKNAPITLIEYGDYQCPFCARFFSETESKIKSAYVDTGKVRFVYKNFAFLGPESLTSAEATLCAADQGKFWEYHSAIFQTEIEEAKTNPRTENSGNLNRTLFLGLAKNFNLDITAFTSCIDSEKNKNKIQKETIEAEAVLTNPSTPSFFLNGTPIQGAQPFSVFQQIIEATLKK